MVLFDANGWTNVRRDREFGLVTSPRIGNAILGELYLRGSRIGTVPTIDMTKILTCDTLETPYQEDIPLWFIL